MHQNRMRRAIAGLPLGEVQFFDQVGSTNDVALAWAMEGAPDLSLVYAEMQTAGRGRGTHRWLTPPASALAFSIILRSPETLSESLSHFTGLGAVAVCEALESLGLSPQIKWPNDVLLNRRKAGGILTEAIWLGETLESVVIGIGLNVKSRSVPPPEQVAFPATCVENETGRKVDRPRLLREILRSFLYWREHLDDPSFLQAWEKRLAFIGEEIEIFNGERTLQVGVVQGLDIDGSLRLLSSSGEIVKIQVGEVHLRSLV